MDKRAMRTSILALALMATIGMASQPIGAAIATAPTQPTLDEEEHRLIGDDKPIIHYVLTARDALGRWKAMGATARAALIVFLLMGALQVKVIRKYVWDPIPQRWRIVTLLVLSTAYGVLTNISGGQVLWYNALLDACVSGAGALLTKKLLWNALLGEGKTLQIEKALKLMKLQ